MIRLDIPALEIFVAAVEEKSLSKAAERENVVTSAASKRVAELERQVGTLLLRRHGRGAVFLEDAIDYEFIGYFPRHTYPGKRRTRVQGVSP